MLIDLRLDVNLEDKRTVGFVNVQENKQVII